MSDQMLSERQVFEVIRIEDNCFIEVHYTMKLAVLAKLEYEINFDEQCRIGRSYITGEETVAQRNANEQL